MAGSSPAMTGAAAALSACASGADVPQFQRTAARTGRHNMKRIALAGLLAIAVAAPAAAQDLPRTQLNGIGLNSPTPVSIYDELPFWRKTIPDASKGAVVMDITPLDQMGIDDKTLLRLLKLGVADFAAMDISKMAGDDPRFEGCD